MSHGRRFRSAALLLATLAVAACGDSDAAGPVDGLAPAIVGTWDLASVGGQALPVADFADNIESESLRFTASGRVTGTAVLELDGERSARVWSGTYTTSSDSVFVTGSYGSAPFSHVYVLAGDALSRRAYEDAENPGIADWVYARR